MKAPNKIYICIERTYGASDGQVIAMVTPHNERQSVNDIEYIRKDALMEWAKECKSDVADDVSHGDAFACRYNCGMNELIEKINSL